MSKFVTLLIIELKRVFKALPQILIGATVLIPVISAVAFSGYKLINHSTGDAIYSKDIHFGIGIVSYDNSTLFNIGLGILKGNDSTSFLDFFVTDEATAREMLKDNKIIAAMIIPENIVSSIMDGTNVPITILFPDNPGLEALLISEITRTPADILSSFQSGIYASYDFLIEYADANAADKANTSLNSIYINNMLYRNKIYVENEQNVTGALSGTQYYICAGITMVYMIFGITLSHFFASYGGLADAMLKKRGYSAAIQFLSKALSVSAVYFALSLIAALLGLIFGGYGFSPVTRSLPVILASSLIAGIYITLMYKLSGSGTSGVMLIFIFSLVLCISCGCFIPRLMMNDAVIAAGNFTPAGIIFNMFAGLIGKV